MASNVGALAASPDKAPGVCVGICGAACEALRASGPHLMDRSAFITGNAAARRDQAIAMACQGGDPGSVRQAYSMSRSNHADRGDVAW